MKGSRAGVDFQKSQIRQPFETRRSMTQTESMRHTGTFMWVIVFSVLLVFSGCGGGGSLPGPEPGSPVSPPCIQTHEDGCLTGTDFQTKTSELAKEYRDNDMSLDNQWGLETVNADWAYAHVELLKGEDAKPGAGVTIGFIDSGIDTGHPQFAGKTVTETFLDDATDETNDEFSHGTAVARGPDVGPPAHAGRRPWGGIGRGTP